MRAWLIIGLMMMSMNSFSQAPGYMGRRLTITAELGFFNSLFNPNANYNTGVTRFNHREIIDLDYVITRDGSVGLTFEVVNTSIAYEGWNDPKFDSPLLPNLPSSFKYGRITGQTFGVNYKLYRNPSRGGIAPLGGYAKFDLLVSRTELFPYDRENDVQAGRIKEYYTPVLAITYGRQRILWNAIIIRTGIQIGLVPTGVLPYFSGITSDIEHDDPHKELHRVHDARLFSYYAINVNVGIGFLAPFRHRPR